MFDLDLEEEMQDLKWEADVQYNELSSGLCDDPGGWDGRGVGREAICVPLELIHVVVQP